MLSRPHVLLFPSRWEVFGRIVLDSLACGTPVVCFDIPGAPQDLIKRYEQCKIGYVAKPFSINDYIRGVLFYWRLWKEMSERYHMIYRLCRSIALNYRYNRIAERFLSMFSEVIQDA